MQVKSALILSWLLLAVAGSAQARQSYGSQRAAPVARKMSAAPVTPAVPRVVAQRTGAPLQWSHLSLDAGLSHRRPPQGWDRQDAAHTLWRLAKKAMDDDNFRQAVEYFDRIHEVYPRSTYAPESWYWEAFARYRLGGESNVRRAVAHLDTQQRLYPRTPTAADGLVLATRLRGHLAMSGDTAARRQLAAVLQTANGCSQSGVDVKIAALSAFRQLDPSMTVHYLRDVFDRRTPCASYLRQQSVFLLAQVQLPEASEILLDLARNSRELDVRMEAVQWISDVRDDRSIGVLREILLGPSPFQLKETAIFSLTQLATASDAIVFQEISASRHTQVSLRVKAVEWLAEQRLQEHSDWILNLYREDRNPAIREAAVKAIAGQRNLADREWLLNVGRDTTASLALRKQAIGAAAEMHTPPGDLYSLYHQVQQVPLREQIIDLLGRNREKSAVERLIDIAMLDADSTLRTSSVKWLRQSKDPRAVEFMIAYRER